MKKALKVIALLLCVTAIAFCGCGKTPPVDKPVNPPKDEVTFTPHPSAKGIADRLTLESEKLSDFSTGGSKSFYFADGWSNGGNFDCTWSRDSAAVLQGILSMSLESSNGGYRGAEYRTDRTSSYGFYSVYMKAAKCSGVISSFFLYTSKPVWDEIDIEFLGKDTTKVQFNYYTSGVGGHEFIFDLGFDASEEFHEYAFDWAKGSITWYVDGVAVYRAIENIPSHSAQIMANVWNCKGADEWSGKFDPSGIPVSAQYKWIAFSESAA